jgi:hypothetical protein
MPEGADYSSRLGTRSKHHCEGISLVDLLRVLPATQVRDHILKVHPSVLSGLLTVSKVAYEYLSIPYFLDVFGAPRLYRPLPRQHFRLELSRGTLRWLEKTDGREPRLHQLLALANGYANGYLCQRRFDLVMKLLEKPEDHRTLEDLTHAGIRSTPRQYWFMRQAWAIIGLVNGVMDPKDFDGVDLFSPSLPAAFWKRRFPGWDDDTPTPGLLAEDWIQVGEEVQEDGADFLARYKPQPPRRPPTLDRIRNLSYLDRFHYVACVASRRLFDMPLGPYPCKLDRYATLQMARQIFGARHQRRAALGNPAAEDAAEFETRFTQGRVMERERRIAFCELL